MPVREDLRLVRAAARYAVAELTRGDDRIRRRYELLHSHDGNRLMTDDTMYMNLGYWTAGCASLDEAAEAMADLIADSAGMKPGDRVLDVGFGYGDQTMRWAQTRRPAQIVGVDVTPVHVETARRRAAERGLDGVVSFRQGSATALDVEPGSFDKVCAVECGFYFFTREDFFHQAYRALRPGGVLTMADVIPIADPATGEPPPRPKSGIFRTMHLANWYTQDSYAQRLSAAGFVDIRLRSIRDQVLEPFLAYFTDRINGSDLELRGLSRLFRSALRLQLRKYQEGKASGRKLPGDETSIFDYVIASAAKPA